MLDLKPLSRARRFVLTLGCVAIVAALAAPGAATAAPDTSETGRFIVVLRDSVPSSSAVAAEHAARYGAEVSDVYEHALKGYAATFRGTGASDVARDGRVAYVERDAPVSLSESQMSATWGLDRSDQRLLPLNGSFNYTATGTGVKAYIIDTGIRFTHSEFGGRAVSGVDKVDGGTADDCNGHGTHVAGTTGGSTYGVAKGVALVAVRVLDCGGGGTISGVIGGVDWVTGDHLAGVPAVANMSLGGGASSSLDTAVRNSIADGVGYSIAAGNGNLAGVHQDACKSSPARVGEAMTISATNSSDKKASFANYGNCVDWFAPGVSITSSWYQSDTQTNTISGTSMAAPHVAGVAALYLEGNPVASPSTVRNALYDLTTKGIVTSSKTVNNHLLFTNF